MINSTPASHELNPLLTRLESELKLCDEMGLFSVAIDLNQAIEKLKIAIATHPLDN